MKIGLISEAYPPMSGGVATSAQRVARNLVKAGNDVIVLTFENTHDVTEQDLLIREEDILSWIGESFRELMLMKMPELNVHIENEQLSFI